MAWALLAGLLSIAGPAKPAEAEPLSEQQERQDARWIPGISVFSTGLPERRKAEASSDTLDDEDGDSTAFAWSVGGSAEIATPVLADIPGRPRLYMHGDVSVTFESDDTVLSDGDPGPPEVVGTIPTVPGITGVGQSVRAEIKPLLLTGGVGSIWSFEAFERTVRIRPSLEWMYQRQTIKSELGGGENEGTDPILCGPSCRGVFIKSQTEKGYHSLGPGLEIEVDAARAGDVLISFFALGRAYRILGDRKASVGGTGEWFILEQPPKEPPDPSTREDTEFRATYEREPWHYRVGFGLRFSWLPD